MASMKQDIRRGASFPPPGDRQSDGSLFIRTDLPGMPVFQYSAANGCYFQVESLEVVVEQVQEHPVDGSGQASTP